MRITRCGHVETCCLLVFLILTLIGGSCRADEIQFSKDTALQIADRDFKNALAIWGNGTSKTAEKLLLEALMIRQRELGAFDPKTAEVLERLGALAYNRRQFSVAESYFRRTLDIDIRSLGERNFATTVALGDLGASLREQHRLQEAEATIQREVSLRRHILDPNHPAIAASLNNLGRLYIYEHRYDDAQGALEESLRIYKIDYPAGSAVVESGQSLLEQLSQIQKIVRVRRYFEIAIGCLVVVYLMLIYDYHARISRYANERSATIARQQMIFIVMMLALGSFSLCMPLFLMADPVTHVFRWNNRNDQVGASVFALMATGGLFLIWLTTLRLVVSKDEISITWLFGRTRTIRLDQVESAVLSFGAKGSRTIVLMPKDSAANKFRIPISSLPSADQKNIQDVISKRTKIVDARTLVSPEKRRKTIIAAITIQVLIWIAFGVGFLFWRQRSQGGQIKLDHVIANNFQFLFPFLFVAVWLMVTTILALLSGWFEVAARFPDQTEEPSLRIRGQSGTMGLGVHMSGILTLCVCSSGLRVGMMRVFGPFCRNFFVPWKDITVVRKTFILWPIADLKFGNPTVGKLRVSARVADRLARASLKRWPEAGPFPEERPEDAFRKLLVEWAVATCFAALFFILAPMALAPSANSPPILVAVLFPAVVFGVVSVVRFIRRTG